ncbi:MAG: polysaccharide deacetylase family protein [Flavobacteriaceae bacterium]|nr:polysaccharide deacetylase family protein [Flavobacteriaceae bacterium]
MLKFNTINILTLILVVFFQLISVSIWFYGCLFLVWLTITSIGSLHIRWNYHVNSLNSNYEVAQNEVSITFDDGPHAEFTPKVLELLKVYNVKATFFCIGKHIESNPELFRRIISEGHTVGNHTFNHKNNFGFIKTKEVVRELETTNEIIEKVSGLKAKIFRPPFGVTNPRIKKGINTVGLQSIGWSIRSFDTTSKSKNTIVKSIEKKLQKGDIVLLHDTSDKSVEILEQLLLFLKQNKLESVTIDSLFNIKAYA